MLSNPSKRIYCLRYINTRGAALQMILFKSFCGKVKGWILTYKVSKMDSSTAWAAGQVWTFRCPTLMKERTKVERAGGLSISIKRHEGLATKGGHCSNDIHFTKSGMYINPVSLQNNFRSTTLLKCHRFGGVKNLFCSKKTTFLAKIPIFRCLLAIVYCSEQDNLLYLFCHVSCYSP